MTTLEITCAQFTLLEQALKARDNAAREAQLVLGAMTAGFVPDAAVLVQLDPSTHTLTFELPRDDQSAVVDPIVKSLPDAD